MADQTLRILERDYLTDPSKGPELLKAYQRAGDIDKYLNLRASLGYIAEVSVLPMPTENQTYAFTQYVATAHSWYKHLRSRVPTTFHFFLNPHVMMYEIREDHTKFDLSDNNNRVVAFTSVNKGDQRWHYNQKETADYRKQFGYWDYRVESMAEIAIYSEGPCKKLSIPKHLLEIGSTGLTVHVHGNSVLFRDVDIDLRLLEDLKDTYAKRDAQHTAMVECMRAFITQLQQEIKQYQ